MFQGAKVVEEDNLQISQVFQGPKCSKEQSVAEKQSVLRSKVFQGEGCSRKQTVLSKMCWEAKYPQEAKCSREQSVYQP